MRTKQTINKANTTTAPRPEQISASDENESVNGLTVNSIDISSSHADSSKPSNPSGRCSECLIMTEPKLKTMNHIL